MMKHAAAPAATPDPVTEAAQREAALQRLAHIFRRAGSDFTMQALMRTMVEYWTQK
jgi:hypothetical protein